MTQTTILNSVISQCEIEIHNHMTTKIWKAFVEVTQTVGDSHASIMGYFRSIKAERVLTDIEFVAQCCIQNRGGKAVIDRNKMITLSMLICDAIMNDIADDIFNRYGMVCDFRVVLNADNNALDYIVT